jgi:hypothetical protein
VAFPPDAEAPAWISEQLVRCQALYVQIREVLRSRDRVICMDLIFGIVIQLLRLMGNEDWRQKNLAAATGGTHPSGGEGNVDPPLVSAIIQDRAWGAEPWTNWERTYAEMLREGTRLVDRLCQKEAQSFYFVGMIAAISALLLGAVLVGGQGAMTGLPQWGSLVLISTTVGGTGAIVSVMQRMGTGKLSLQYRAPRWQLVLLGVFRPILGCVFGGLVAMIYVAGLLPVQPPNASDEARLGFLAVLGFAAGFTERLAQDMLTDATPMIGLKRGPGEVD